MVKSTDGNIILDCQTKACDCWVNRVKFLQETIDKSTQSATASHKKNMNEFHVELCHQSKSFIHAINKAINIQVFGMFMPCEDCTLGKAKQ